jgi:hypothetical protein
MTGSLTSAAPGQRPVTAGVGGRPQAASANAGRPAKSSGSICPWDCHCSNRLTILQDVDRLASQQNLDYLLFHWFHPKQSCNTNSRTILAEPRQNGAARPASSSARIAALGSQHDRASASATACLTTAAKTARVIDHSNSI